MTGRHVSRVPFKPRRDRRQAIIAVGAAVAIILFTVVAVFILAPNDESTPTFNPTPTVPSDTSSTSTPAPTEPPVTTVAPDGG